MPELYKKKVYNNDDLTHRKTIRKLKQGIDYSIANHIEYLTSKWPREEQLSEHTKRLYKQGINICTLWAQDKQCTIGSYCDDNSSQASSNMDMDDELSDSSEDSISSNTINSSLVRNDVEKNRYRFDSTMYDNLKRIIILEVFSHQLNEDFSVKGIDKQPRPNIFVTLANQFVDNAATQAKVSIIIRHLMYEKIFYPPFSPRWTFTFEGCITNKGASKILQDKLDEELDLRIQHRVKQGLFYRLRPFIGIDTEQIGDKSLLRSIVKQTAPCWRRSIYRYPPLANQIWHYWRAKLPQETRTSTPVNIPKRWQKITHTSDEIIKACPFCDRTNEGATRRSGNREHLHLYCNSQTLIKACFYCHQKIENAIYKLYEDASMREYDT